MLERLSTSHRYLLLVIAAALVILYVVPIWSIRLVAPQYPEGLGMTLWIDRIVGHSEFDLQNINLLNHYIGMEPIIEASIPEFRYTPYILGFTIAGAMVAFFYPRRCGRFD